MERVLLVEGSDDERVVHHICKRLQVPLDFCIEDKGGVDKLLRSITPELKAPDRVAVGILLDANDSADSRWQSIAGHLQSGGIAPPSHLDRSGIVIEGRPRVGVWLMPDNESPGEIEDFVVKLIPNDDPQWPRAREYIDGSPECERKFNPRKTLRAKLYAWLATRKSSPQMGRAIEAGDLDIDHPVAATFVEWLTRTFSD
jgi:hypothetical protein